MSELTGQGAEGVHKMLMGHYATLAETAARMPDGKEYNIAILEVLAFAWGLEPICGPIQIPVGTDFIGKLTAQDVLKLGQKLKAELDYSREFWRDRPADTMRLIAEIEWRVRAGGLEALAHECLAPKCLAHR